MLTPEPFIAIPADRHAHRRRTRRSNSLQDAENDQLRHIRRQAQATDAAANRASPASSTGRRPCLSDSGPQTSKNTLKLANQSTSDSATRLSGAPHRFAMIGIAAKYMSVASAGTAARAARNKMYADPLPCPVVLSLKPCYFLNRNTR